MMDFNAYKSDLISTLSRVEPNSIELVVQSILKTRKGGGTVFVAGNGGSAATASHMATDLMFGSKLVNPSLKVFSLNDNNSIITATGNDIGFEHLFTRQLQFLSNPGDLVILISASGNSPNILKCIEICKPSGLQTVGLVGFDGGKLSKLVDVLVHVPTEKGKYGIVEDIHMIIGHAITQLLRDQADLESVDK
jgi:D-sedoheptulose 7-phosphate isomerase